MRHRTTKYKAKATRKNPNKERIVDVHSNLLDNKYVKKLQKKSRLHS